MTNFFPGSVSFIVVKDNVLLLYMHVTRQRAQTTVTGKART